MRSPKFTDSLHDRVSADIAIVAQAMQSVTDNYRYLFAPMLERGLDLDKPQPEHSLEFRCVGFRTWSANEPPQVQIHIYLKPDFPTDEILLLGGILCTLHTDRVEIDIDPSACQKNKVAA